MKTKSFLVTMLTLFCFAAVAFAGGPAEMKTDVPTIPETECDQAGWISLEVKNGFTMHEGDQIVWSLTNNVPLCKDVEIFLAIADYNENVYGQDTALPVFTSDAADQINVTGTDVVAGVIEDAGGAGDGYSVGFYIRGTAGSNQVTLTFTRIVNTAVVAGSFVGMRGIGTGGTADLKIEFDASGGDPAGDELTIRLFDSANDAYDPDNGAAFVNGVTPANAEAGFVKDDTATTTVKDYVDPINAEDNVLCIDTNNGATLVNGQYVWATPDSQPGVVAGASQVSFSGDYTIANISGAEGYTIAMVGKAECEDIDVSDTVDQFGNPIGPVATSLDVGDYNNAAGCATYRWGTHTTGFCNDGDLAGFGVLIGKSASFSATEQYGMEISLVTSTDGGSTYTAAAANQLYWDGGADVPALFETTSTAVGNIQCDGVTAGASAQGNFAVTTNTTVIATVTYTTGFTLDDGVNNFFTVDSNANNAFLLDLPNFNVVKAAYAAGTMIFAKITLTKFPCGEVAEDYICLGTVVNGCGAGGGGAGALTDVLLFPYGTGAGNANFWTGIAIANTSATDGNATITFYGANGGVGVYSLTVGARDIQNFAMSGIMSSLDAGSTLTSAENFQAVVATDFTADGLMFIGSTNGSQLHGYLPRELP
jgi:hypothetical protein